MFFYGNRGYLYTPLGTGGKGYTFAMNTILALACTVWSMLAGRIGALLANVSARKQSRMPIRLAVSATMTGLGLLLVPLWICRERGYLLLQNSWTHLSCVFVIGRMIFIFPLIAAPLLAVTTLLCEWIILRSKSSLQPHQV